MATPIYRKRRPKQGPSKNELKTSRNEMQERERERAGTLSERFPAVSRLQINLRMETAAGAVLESTVRQISPEEPLLLDVECQGGCGNGSFLLSDAIEGILKSGQELREGLGICQAGSYNDPKLPCGTKLYYKIQASY